MTAIKPLKRRRCSKPSAGTCKSKLSFSDMESLCDEATLDLFNAFASDVRRNPGKPFNFHVKSSITRARAIVQSWRPQKYDAGQRPLEFDVPYLLSGFFDRYISVDERKATKNLQAKAAKKFLSTISDGNVIDQYVLEHDLMAPLINKMRYHMNCFFNTELDINELYKLTGHGPNRTTDVEFDSSYLHIKNQSIAGTDAALQQLLHYLHWDSQLRDALLASGDDAMRATINGWDLDGSSSHFGTVANRCSVTDTSFVSKKFDSLRTMCPDPTAVAFFAKMVARWITQRLRTYCNIDLRSQPEVHRQLAKLGSIFSDLNIATLDWSEASDRIWLLLVEVIMSEGYAPDWFSFMSNVCRCKETNVKFNGTFGGIDDYATMEDLLVFLDEHTDSYSVDLHDNGKQYSVLSTVQTTMFATMGNPLTFPLQTLIFWAFLTSCTELCAEDNNTCLDEYMMCSSFGDDGILDTRVVPTVYKYAEWLGWKPNPSKTFVDGAFRESCGGDYYQGRLVRPFEIRRPELLEDSKSDSENKVRIQAWLYIGYNNLCSIVRNLSCDPTSLELWLLKYHKLFGLGKVCLVPPDYPDGSGARTYDIFKEAMRDVRPADVSLQGWSSLRCYDCGPAISSLDDMIFADYHNPWQTQDGMWNFRYLSSKPRELIIDEFEAGHYYHDTLKRCIDGSADDYQPTLSFFASHKKQLARLNREGNIPRKECRIRKTKGTIAIWSDIY